jgi:hypothetical protein
MIGLIHIIFDAGDDNGHMLCDFWFLENRFSYGHKGVNELFSQWFIYFPSIWIQLWTEDNKVVLTVNEIC